MNKHLSIPFVMAVLLASSAAAGSRLEQRAQKRFELIKSLAGDWVKVDDDGKPTDELVSTYRVTAGGSAVLETVFPGSEMEMITLYHRDQGALVLTHYCVAGNQPHMRETGKPGRNQLLFACSEHGGNMATEDERHMHQASVELSDPDHMSSVWLMFEGGEVVYTASFNLARVH